MIDSETPLIIVNCQYLKYRSSSGCSKKYLRSFDLCGTSLKAAAKKIYRKSQTLGGMKSFGSWSIAGKPKPCCSGQTDWLDDLKIDY